MALKPVIQRQLPAPEAVDPVLAVKRLGLPIGHALVRVEDTRAREESVEAWVVAWRPIEKLDKLLPLLWRKRESSAVGQEPLGLVNRSIDDELGQAAIRRLRRLAHHAIRLGVDSEVPALACCRRHCHSVRTTYARRKSGRSDLY